MSITAAGAVCDVCGKYILPMPGELVHKFSVKQIDADMHCDNACKGLLIAAGSDWQKLPTGPLRKAFEEAAMQGLAKEKKP